jgi:hypothetical protein
MKNQTSPIDDLKHIRQMMEESSKFLSLSGLSGIAVGSFALLGAAIAHFFILEQGNILYDEFLRALPGAYQKSLRLSMFILAISILTGALLSAWFISFRKSKKMNVPFWTSSAKKMVASLFSVLITGGLFCIILIFHGYFKMIAAVMLLFYGLALLNSSKYSKHDLKSLAYTQIFLGLLAATFLNYGLLIWTVGFGIVHILYGIIMYYKYELSSNR